MEPAHATEGAAPEMTTERRDKILSGDQVNPEDWRSQAERALKEPKNAIAFTEGLLKARLYFHTLSLEEKVKYFETLAKMYRTYFSLSHYGTEDELQKDVAEQLEDAVEDWGEMILAQDTFIGIVEPEDKKKQRLEQWQQYASKFFEEIKDNIKAHLHKHASSPEFQKYLRKMFGNVDMIEFLKDNPDMQNCRNYLIKEDEENPFFNEVTVILNTLLAGGLDKRRTPDPPSEQMNFEALVKKYVTDKDHKELVNYFSGISLIKPPKNKNSIPEWMESMQNFVDDNENGHIETILKVLREHIK